jgi:hypothetical protein
MRKLKLCHVLRLKKTVAKHTLFPVPVALWKCVTRLAKGRRHEATSPDDAMLPPPYIQQQLQKFPKCCYRTPDLI